jgi:hypothetical protein
MRAGHSLEHHTLPDLQYLPLESPPLQVGLLETLLLLFFFQDQFAALRQY